MFHDRKLAHNNFLSMLSKAAFKSMKQRCKLCLFVLHFSAISEIDRMLEIVPITFLKPVWFIGIRFGYLDQST